MAHDSHDREHGAAAQDHAAADEKTGKRTRAARMSPEERRAAIIAATVPLVRTSGFDVSTRQIAEAADIAEGTIFRVFETKEDLLKRAVQAALDPGDMAQRLLVIDLTSPLAERLRWAAELLQQRMAQMIELASTVGPGNFPVQSRDLQKQHEQLHELLVKLFEPDRDQLRVDPARAAGLLRMVAFGGSNPRLVDGPLLTPTEIVDLLLDGIRDHDAAPSDGHERAGHERSRESGRESGGDEPS
ncbi:TetR/AcrR family transcriptional regulator [Phytoactinopolyspora halotolerans]|uniref:TetR/AcrR family transcriptional regulator n=1 Tax=Phytoactinopolyspora halotolerans TaxID=1981512 RepID=A0A6L9S5N7_9ACTN|nr:TetR/AcrR family transcriptional regulator [Phytoactinopolyspora halotolerans]NEE00765.1 TetR/AcrR family transcriptional regulator [Phytoactinopolyspora halotolerans]